MMLVVALLKVGFQLVVQKLGGGFVGGGIEFANANPDFSYLLCLSQKLDLNALFLGILPFHDSA